MFKFYKIQTDDIIEKLLGTKATIKFSSAFDLNDPYELKFNLDLDPMADGHESRFYESRPGATKDDFLYWQKHAKEYNGYTWVAEQDIRNNLAQTIALCSFTESNNSNLMWSHYTDNHKGICIEYKPELFDYLNTLDSFFVFSKIDYSDEPPTIKISEDPTVIVKKMMFNKQSEWKYEKEHRVIFWSNKDVEYIPIDRNFIKSVFIGSRADYTIVKKILAISREFGVQVNYGVTLGTSYTVNFEEHKDGRTFARAFWR